MKRFFVLWTSQAFSIFGSTIVGFALAWYLAKETGSATILSTAMLVNILPEVALGPFIGPFIDRWNRKKILIYSDIVTSLLTLVLVVLFSTGTIQIWHIYVIMAGRSAAGAFQRPALSASIPMVVPEKHLARANGLNVTLIGYNRVVAPIAGAFLMEAVEMQWVLSVDIITAIMAVGCLIPLALPQPPRKNLSVKPDYFTELRHGFRYMISWRGLSLLVILFAILTFFAAPANALLPLFVTEYFNADVIILGYLMTAHSAGLIAGGLILGAWGGFKRRIVTILVFLMVQAIAVFLFSFTSQSLLFLAIAMRFVSGLCSAMLGAPVDAILQSTVAKDMLGRVFALMNSLTGIMMPLALAVAGPVADAIGLRAIWYVSAAVIFTIAGLAFFSRDLMNIENTKTEE